MLVRFALAIFAAGALGQGYAQSDYVAEDRIPAEVRPFIEPDTRVLALQAADLNSDKLRDYVLVLEKQLSEVDPGNPPEGQRPLVILVRQADGKLVVAKRNDKIVYCSFCGGVFGDPFAGIAVRPGGFTVSHYGGSNWRWGNSFRFAYSRRDQTWQLVRVEETTFNAGDPARTKKTEVLVPPKHYGKIDIADFDPQRFRGQGAR